MTIYGLKNCDTCRKARKALPEFTFQDVREVPLDREQLTAAYEMLGEALVNRKSTTWRALSPEARALHPVELMMQNPAVMKRPLIHAEGKWWLGWGQDVQAALLGT